MKFFNTFSPRRARVLGHLNPLKINEWDIFPARIYFMRHAESMGNQDPDAYRNTHDTEIGLTANGVVQADAAAQFLKDELLHMADEIGRPIRVGILHSPYVRVIETRDIMANVLLGCDGINLETIKEDLHLIEKQFGSAARFPTQEEYDNHYRDALQDHDFIPEFYRDMPGDIESYRNLCLRVRGAVNNIFRFATHDILDVVLVISHSQLLRAMEKEYHWRDQQAFDQIPKPKNASIRSVDRVIYYDPARAPGNPELCDRIKSFNNGVVFEPGK